MSKHSLNDSIINKKLNFGGYKTYSSEFFDTPLYIELDEDLEKKLKKKSSIKPLDIQTLKNIKILGNQIIKKHTQDTNIDINQTEKEKIDNVLALYFGNTLYYSNIDEILEVIKNATTIKPATEIPITHSFALKKNANIYFYDNPPLFRSLNHYKKLPPIVLYIDIVGPLNSYDISCYIHEIYHALSERNKGFTNNYLYEEFLPIFMELVATLDTPFDSDEAINNRLHYLRKSINKLKSKKSDSTPATTENQKYILSSLNAIALFDIYRNAKNSIKNEIDNQVNKIITGDIQIEDLLNNYEISAENGVYVVKKQLIK